MSRHLGGLVPLPCSCLATGGAVLVDREHAALLSLTPPTAGWAQAGACLWVWKCIPCHRRAPASFPC